MGLYIKLEDVRIRLIGKVRFTTDVNEENKMHESLANRLILEAEGQVELDLSPRYAAPFQTIDGTAFKNLPDNPTKNVLRTLCELQSCMRILENDFGAGTAIDADKYVKKLKERYDEIVSERLLAKRKGKEETQQWSFPPLKSLKLNWHNTEADDGYLGMVLVTGQGDGDYPAKQINDPSENWWNGVLDD